MIFEGQEAFGYSVKDVWTGLHNLAILKKAIPGCKSMAPKGDSLYVIALSLGVAAVRGDYEGTVKVTDDQPLVHYIIEGSGKGSPGFVQLRMDCWFEGQAAGTLMRWRCEATVGGLIASFGTKVLAGASKYMAQQFFSSFKKELRNIAVPTGDERSIIKAPAGTSASGSNQGSVIDKPTAANGFWAALWRKLFRRSGSLGSTP